MISTQLGRKASPASLAWPRFLTSLDEAVATEGAIFDLATPPGAGMALAPSAPGIGVEWDFDKVKAKSLAEFTQTIGRPR